MRVTKNKSFLSSFLTFIVEHGIKTICGILSSLLIINYLIPDEYGTYSLGLSLLSITSPLAALGLDSILLKKQIKKLEIQTIYASIFLRILSSALIFSVFAVLHLAYDNSLSLLSLLLSFSLLPESFRGFREFTFAQKEYTIITWASSMGNILQLITTFFAIHLKLTIYFFAVSIIINRLVQSAILIWMNRDHLKKFQIHFLKNSTTILREGLPLLIASIGGLIYTFQDQWVLKFLLGLEQVGIYAAGIKFVIMALVIPTIITNILFEKIIHQVESKSHRIEELYRVLFFISLGLYVILFLASKPIVENTMPDSYHEAFKIMRLYGLIIPISFYQSLNNKMLLTQNLQRFISLRIMMSIILNLSLNFILIPAYGINGAIIATILTEVIVLISYYFWKETSHIFRYQINGLNLLKLKKASFELLN